MGLLWTIGENVTYQDVLVRNKRHPMSVFSHPAVLSTSMKSAPGTITGPKPMGVPITFKISIYI